MNPIDTITAIPTELDKPNWILEKDDTDIQVFSKFGASSAPVIGFKTVTTHSVSALAAYTLLKDVNKAMELVNDQFALGEVLKSWPTDFDPDGTVVRTSFDLPWPMGNREFPHGLHSKQLDANTFVVAYTPVSYDDITARNGYIQCPMFASGQRITQLETGCCKVEHLMVYELGGSISKSVQDNWMKGAHAGAYVKEWRKLREVLFPTILADINHTALTNLAQQSFKISENWPLQKKLDFGSIHLGRLAYCPRNVVRTSMQVNASLEKVTEVIADKSLEFLPQWNKEFNNGHILETLEESATKSAWLVQVEYNTPFFLDNREYVYYFSREWISDDEVMVLYQSVDDGKGDRDGVTRSLLYPTAHKLTRIGNNQTQIDHLLATDLCGKLGSKQDCLLKGGLIQAHVRDMTSQLALFASFK